MQNLQTIEILLNFAKIMTLFIKKLLCSEEIGL